MKSENRHPEYYEAILQLRPATDEVIDFIRELIIKRDDVKISKVVELKTGIDVYLTNQRFARSTLGPMLKRKFKKGKLTVTRSLHSRNRLTNKLVYRATVLFRLE